MKLIILISLLFFSSINGKSDAQVKTQSNERIEIFGNQVKKLPTNISTDFDKAKIRSWLAKNYFNGRQLKVEFVQTYKNVKIFKVEVLDNIPTNMPKIYTFIYALNIKSCFLLPFEFNQFINIKDDIMFGGIYSYREFDYYFIYRLDNQILQIVFDSRKVNDRSVKIGYHRDDECLEYKPNRLNYSYDKRNKITFNGTIKIFCKTGVDRNPEQKSAIKTEKVLIILNYVNKQWIYNNTSSKYKFW